MNEVQNLARCRDQDLAGAASGAGAQALLTSITAEEPQFEGRVVRTSRTRRALVGAVAAGGLAAAAVIGPAFLGKGGTATSYANSAMDIRLQGDHYVAVIKDPLADFAKFTERFKAVGLNVRLEPAPSAAKFEALRRRGRCPWANQIAYPTPPSSTGSASFAATA